MERFCTRKRETISLARLEHSGKLVCVEHGTDKDCIEVSCKYHLGQEVLDLALGPKRVTIDYTQP